MPRTHIIVTAEGDYGWSMQSPQLPGFVFARPTRTEFLADYQKALRIEGVAGEVVSHHQQRFVSPEGAEYLIRVADGIDNAERLPIMHQLVAVMGTDQRFSSLAEDRARLRTGEVLFVCVLASDTIGWLMEQMDPRGDVLNAALGVAEVMVLTTQFARGETRPDWGSLDEMGWSLDTTMATVAADQSKTPRVMVAA